MHILATAFSIILSIFSTTVMSYIAMATPIGPWIAPTVLLCALLFYVCFYKAHHLEHMLVYTTIAASVGGILATAFGFTFPTFYFLDASSFNQWLQDPIYFCVATGLLSLLAGWYGLWIANILEPTIIANDQLPFPIAQLIYKMIMVQHQLKKAFHMVLGFVTTFICCALQDGLYAIQAVIPKTIFLCTNIHIACVKIPALYFDVWPMLWAIGFVTGQAIVIPLLVGTLSRIMIAQPLQQLFFSSMQSLDFILAFCSGMVLSGVVSSFIPKKIDGRLKKPHLGAVYNTCHTLLASLDRSLYYEGLLISLSAMAVLSYFGFSFMAQGYLLVATALCAYQIVIIAGKIGLAQLGRFATFVLVPALCVFNINMLQATLISMFVEISTGVAVDILCGRKIVALAHAHTRSAKRYQYLGLITSCVTIGIVSWLFIRHFSLGSSELFAQRAQARALLIHAKQFDYYAVFIGLIYGLLLKKLSLNPMLVLGGLLMPLNLSIGLVTGGLMTLLTRDAQEYFPFWSGVFAANSIWMLVQSLL